MKYTITILAILFLASCKKDYKCTCNDKDGHEVSTGNWKYSRSTDVSEITQRCTGEAVGYNIQYPTKAPITCSLD